MSRSLIQTTNQSTQTVALNSIISLGSVLRRFGCNCKLSGNAIELSGEGYYTIDATVTATPTAAGNVTVALFNNGVQIPGTLVTSSVTTTGNSTTIPIVIFVLPRPWPGQRFRRSFCPEASGQCFCGFACRAPLPGTNSPGGPSG